MRAGWSAPRSIVTSRFVGRSAAWRAPAAMAALAVGGGAALAVSANECYCAEAGSKVALESVRAGPHAIEKEDMHPIIVLVHGLDSAKDTWKSTQVELETWGYQTIALDLRAHGESPIGNEADFNPKQLAKDMRATIKGMTNRRLILVGHSMGARVAMRYAADYPEDIGALIVEDMDTRPREYEEPSDEELERMRAFTPSFETKEELDEALSSFGYADDRIAAWWESGRLVEKEKGVWSGVNPLAHHLAMKNVLASTDASDAWKSLAKHNGREGFDVHLWVADHDSSCAREGKYGSDAMIDAVPRTERYKFRPHGHSIHNDAPIEAAGYIRYVYNKAQCAIMNRYYRKKSLTRARYPNTNWTVNSGHSGGR